MKKTILGSMVIVSAMALAACNFGGSKPVNIVTDEYDFEESFENIDIDLSCEDVHIMESEDEECHIVFVHPDNLKTTVEVKNNKLLVSEKSTFAFNPFGDDVKDTKLEIYVPKGDMGEIDIDTASADVILTKVVADTISINTASGEVNFEESDADKISVDTASGDVNGTLLSGKDFSVNTASGKVDVPHDSDGGSCEIDTAIGNVKLEVV